MFMVQIRDEQGNWYDDTQYGNHGEARDEAIRMSGPSKACKRDYPEVAKNLNRRVTRVKEYKTEPI